MSMGTSKLEINISFVDFIITFTKNFYQYYGVLKNHLFLLKEGKFTFVCTTYRAIVPTKLLSYFMFFHY